MNNLLIVFMSLVNAPVKKETRSLLNQVKKLMGIKYGATFTADQIIQKSLLCLLGKEELKKYEEKENTNSK